MVSALKRIYSTTKNETYLTNAVSKGFITVAQKAEIMESVA